MSVTAGAYLAAGYLKDVFIFFPKSNSSDQSTKQYDSMMLRSRVKRKRR